MKKFKGVLGFPEIFGIILLKKNLWNRFTATWTGSMDLAHVFRAWELI
jgi:hypothetical protein